MYKDGDDLALWAHRRLPAKNTLTANDARAVEAAYQAILNGVYRDAQGQPGQVPIWNRGAFIHFTGVGSAGSAARSALARASQLSFGLQF
jgi:hypothetical protein